MADFFFITEMAGFQHGDSPFYLKRISLAPVRAGSGTLVSFTYATDFVLTHSDSEMRTYHYTTRHIHGIALDETGVPYDLRGETIRTAIKHHIFQTLQTLPYEYQPTTRILLLTKGLMKIGLLEELVPVTDFLSNLIIRDLADYGCPPAHKLLGGERATKRRPRIVFGLVCRTVSHIYDGFHSSGPRVTNL